MIALVYIQMFKRAAKIFPDARRKKKKLPWKKSIYRILNSTARSFGLNQTYFT